MRTASIPKRRRLRESYALVGKLENHRNDFFSERFRKKNGAPDPNKLLIVAKRHPDTDQKIVDLLESCREWLRNNYLRLQISRLNPRPR